MLVQRTLDLTLCDLALELVDHIVKVITALALAQMKW